jgi:hypothetical protein
MALREDTLAYPTVISLSACLCLELEKSGGPALCYCGPIAGEVSLDYCGGGCDGTGCGGQAWVRLLDVFPSSVFPSVDSTLANCRSPFAFTIEVGVARCAPMGESGANGYVPPTMEQNVEAIRLQAADIAAMRRAVQCCFGEGDVDYILGQYTQSLVNGGGCIGGAFTVIVWEQF